MADEQDKPKEPTPLSLEGGGMMDIDTKPKPADKATRINSQTSSLIQKIVATPKETGSSDAPDPTSTNSEPKQGIPKVDPVAAITRLEEENRSSGGSPPPPPNPERNKHGAGMLIDAFNAIFLFTVSIWSKDPDTKEYQVETEEKRKLKTYLAEIMEDSGKSIPPLWLFFGLFVITYIPMLWKAWQHRKLVEEERVKTKLGDTITIIEPKRRRRRGSKSNENVEYYHAEEVR